MWQKEDYLGWVRPDQGSPLKAESFSSSPQRSAPIGLKEELNWSIVNCPREPHNQECARPLEGESQLQLIGSKEMEVTALQSQETTFCHPQMSWEGDPEVQMKSQLSRPLGFGAVRPQRENPASHAWTFRHQICEMISGHCFKLLWLICSAAIENGCTQ